MDSDDSVVFISSEDDESGASLHSFPEHEPSSSSSCRKRKRPCCVLSGTESDGDSSVGSDGEWDNPFSPDSSGVEAAKGQVASPSAHHEASQQGLDETHDCGSRNLELLVECLEAEIDVSSVGDPGGPTRQIEDRFIACCGAEAPFLDARAGVASSVTLPSSDPDPKCDFYGMEDSVRKAIFDVHKIEQLHPWQALMLNKHLISGEGMKNALIHAPTSGGKTLVAVILLLRSMILEKKDGILVLPYVAIVSEKVHELKQLSRNLPVFVVAEYAASKGHFPIPRQKSSLRTLYVCTPEKATLVWKWLCAEGTRRNEIGLVAVDECHMITDGSRGGVIEELFVSVLHWSSPSTIILALSATIGNVNGFQVFLGGGRSANCSLHNVHSRPMAINENMIVAGLTIPIVRDEEGKGTVMFSERGSEILNEEEDKLLLQCGMFKGNDQDAIVAKLVFETMKRGESVLVFCGTRKGCVYVCDMLTKAHHSLASDDGDVAGDIHGTHLEEVKKQRTLLIGHLKSESKGMVNPTLVAGIALGIGFHSAELDPIERSAVEDAFKRGIVCALCCTTTLAAGVNLPANRVIIRSPWCGKRFLTCAQYMQMTGRAGRSGLKQKNASRGADSYVLVQPNDSGKFQKLIEQHVEDLTSQLLKMPSHYIRSRSLPACDDHEYTGVTRVLLNSLLVPLKFSELLDVYRLTLLYQNGENRVVEGQPIVVFTLKPLLKELQELLKRNYIVLLKSETAESNLLSITVDNHMSFEVSSVFESKHVQQAATLIEDLKALTTVEVEAFVGYLCEAMQHPLDCIKGVDYFMSLSPIASASSSASMSITDAETFVSEAEHLEAAMCLQNPLAFLYLSITEAMSKPLIEDHQYKELENSRNSMTIGKMLAKDFDHHPDARILTRIGLDKERLMEWVVGNPTIRNSKKFNETLTRAWSALFIKELLANPENADKLCADYMFERSMALELSSMLASRLHNLRQCCMKLGRFWWYPPLASHIARKLGLACAEDVRPLLALRHVTVERARNLLKIGLHTVQDVAQVFPPTMLSEKVPHISRWMAVEIVLDARMLVAEEAALFEAESCDRRRLLH